MCLHLSWRDNFIQRGQREYLTITHRTSPTVRNHHFIQPENQIHVLQLLCSASIINQCFHQNLLIRSYEIAIALNCDLSFTVISAASTTLSISYLSLFDWTELSSQGFTYIHIYFCYLIIVLLRKTAKICFQKVLHIIFFTEVKTAGHLIRQYKSKRKSELSWDCIPSEISNRKLIFIIFLCIFVPPSVFTLTLVPQTVLLPLQPQVQYIVLRIGFDIEINISLYYLSWQIHDS